MGCLQIKNSNLGDRYKEGYKAGQNLNDNHADTPSNGSSSMSSPVNGNHHSLDFPFQFDDSIQTAKIDDIVVKVRNRGDQTVVNRPIRTICSYEKEYHVYYQTEASIYVIMHDNCKAANLVTDSKVKDSWLLLGQYSDGFNAGLKYSYYWSKIDAKMYIHTKVAIECVPFNNIKTKFIAIDREGNRIDDKDVYHSVLAVNCGQDSSAVQYHAFICDIEVILINLTETVNLCHIRLKEQKSENYL